MSPKAVSALAFLVLFVLAGACAVCGVALLWPAGFAVLTAVPFLLVLAFIFQSGMKRDGS